MNSAALQLRIFAERLDAYEAAALWVSTCQNNPDDREVKVSWNWAAGVTGYKELSAAMSRVVARRFAEIRDEALRDLHEAAVQAQLDARASLERVPDPPSQEPTFIPGDEPSNEEAFRP